MYSNYSSNHYTSRHRSMERRSSRASSLVSRSSASVGGNHARPNHVSDADKENKHWHQPGHLTGTLNVVLVPTVRILSLHNSGSFFSNQNTQSSLIQLYTRYTFYRVLSGAHEQALEHICGLGSTAAQSRQKGTRTAPRDRPLPPPPT